MAGSIDRLPTWARDLMFMVASALLTWLGSYVVPYLAGWGGLVAALGAPLLALLVAAVTMWTKAYGRGATEVTPTATTSETSAPSPQPSPRSSFSARLPRY